MNDERLDSLEVAEPVNTYGGKAGRPLVHKLKAFVIINFLSLSNK